MPEEKIASLPDSAFANQTKRLFPINTKADTYLSAAYASVQEIKDESTLSKIKTAARLWGIEDEVNKIASIVDVMVKSAATEDAPAWNIDYTTSNGLLVKGDGRTKEKLAESWNGFYKYFSKDVETSYSDKTAAAQMFYGEFIKMGCEIPFELGAMAEKNLPDFTKVAQEIRSRAVRLIDGDTFDVANKKKNLLKIANDLENSEDKTLEYYSKVAEVLYSVDVDNKLDRFYGKTISTPHEAVFNTTRKEALKKCASYKLGEGEYSYEEIEDLKNKKEMLKLALTDTEIEDLYSHQGEWVEKFNSISNDSKAALHEYLNV